MANPLLKKLTTKIALLQKTVFELIAFELALLKYGLFINISIWFQKVWIFFFGTHMSDLDLSGKTVLITGAANGVGRSTAFALLNLEKPPSKLILWDIESLEEFKKLSETGNNNNNNLSLHANLHSNSNLQTKVYCDKVDLANLNSLTHKLLSKHSTEIHYFLAIAGYANRDLSINLSIDHYQKNLNVNYLSNVKITRMLLEGVGQSNTFKTGNNSNNNNNNNNNNDNVISYNLEKIIYMSSILAVSGLSYFSEYSASKSALKTFAESLQAELFLAKKYDREGQYFDESIVDESQSEKFNRISEFKQFSSYPKVSIVCPQPIKTRFLYGTPVSSAFYHYSKLSRGAVVDAIIKCMYYDIFDEVMVGFIAFFTRMFGSFLHKDCFWEIAAKVGVLQGGKYKKPDFGGSR